MSATICKCVCGAEAEVQEHPMPHPKLASLWRVRCMGCDWRSPLCDTEPEAVEAWSHVMRPRPVAKLGDIGWGYADCKPFGAFGFPPEHYGEWRDELLSRGFDIVAADAEEKSDG